MSSHDAKYDILVRILDRHVEDGVAEGKRSIYLEASNSSEHRDQARARAYIHLFLEAKCGIFDFSERERRITDSSYDGGVDAFYIDEAQRTVFLVQSKFRANAKNFVEKHISVDEVSRIDADRILRGETHDAAGNAYSGHIKGLQRSLQQLPDIARYGFKVVLLANVRHEEQIAVAKILSDFDTEIYDFNRCYEELVIPVLRGEQTYFPDLRFNIDMSNKSAGSRLNAKIKTEHGSVDVTVILAPTLEIARLMSRYRNSILKYNPRSYLEFSQQTINTQIRESITERSTGEFALLNNGITILSDETFVSERIGQKDVAQVAMRNPQIINGGQTAFTLSRIYDGASDPQRGPLFEDKEVVVRIITLPDINTAEKLSLIKEISSATNSQTQVVSADRLVANDEQKELAKRVFIAHGVLYEHKRGEYADAVQKGFVDEEAIIERSLFLRLMLLASGKYEHATRNNSVKKGMGFKDLDTSEATVKRFGAINAVYFSLTRQAPPTPRRIVETLAMVETAMAAMEMGLLPEVVTVGPFVERVEEIWTAMTEWCLERQRRRQGPRRGAQIGPPPEGYRSERSTRVLAWARKVTCPEDVRAYLEEFGLEAPTALGSPLLDASSNVSPGWTASIVP